LEELIEEQRDPFEPIITLLDTDHTLYCNPLAALRTFSMNIISDLPNPATAPYAAAKRLRNYLITRILSATALRSKNLRQLTYREDNTGHLRRVGDKWVIVIPWQNFKNKDSSFFGNKKKKHDYQKELADKDDLYKWIEEYVRVHRPFILRGTESDIFFVLTPNKPMFSAERFSSNYHYLTMVYFAHNPYLGRGVPGVKPHGLHSVRDMIATYVMQQTGSYELAGYAIGDTAWTVREHYVRFMPKHKTRLIEQVIDAAWDAGRYPAVAVPAIA
jgi:integrase